MKRMRAERKIKLSEYTANSNVNNREGLMPPLCDKEGKPRALHSQSWTGDSNRSSTPRRKKKTYTLLSLLWFASIRFAFFAFWILFTKIVYTCLDLPYPATTGLRNGKNVRKLITSPVVEGAGYRCDIVPCKFGFFSWVWFVDLMTLCIPIVLFSSPCSVLLRVALLLLSFWVWAANCVYTYTHTSDLHVLGDHGSEKSSICWKKNHHSWHKQTQHFIAWHAIISARPPLGRGRARMVNPVNLVTSVEGFTLVYLFASRQYADSDVTVRKYR